MELHSPRRKLLSQRVGVTRGHERIPRRPLVPSVVRLRSDLVRDDLQMDLYGPATDDCEERCTFRRGEPNLEPELLFVELDRFFKSSFE